MPFWGGGKAWFAPVLISRQRRFIFVHIFKNAGTSITEALTPFAAGPRQLQAHRILKHFHVAFLDPQPLPGHATASEIMAWLGEETFDSYFSFAIVRNPWDWQVSLYTYMLQYPGHFQHELVKSLGGFDGYLRWRCAPGRFDTQKDFVYSKEGKLLVDFIGRFERLESDFRTICDRIGISTSLPRLNVSHTKPYRDFYTEETAELVRRTFEQDIRLFGYTFE